MFRIIEFMKEHGPAYGYHIKPSKGSYMIGKCTSELESVQIEKTLLGIGLSREVIHRHPGNGGDAALYGVKLLGSYIGTTEFVKAHLKKYVDELDVVANQLVGYENIQDRYLLFRDCFCSKYNYLFRTIPCFVYNEFIASLMGLIKSIVASVL